MKLSPLKVLNGRGGHVSGEPRAATADISGELKKRIQLLYVAHVSEEGVDYRAMKESAEFAAYVAETRRLPSLDVATALPDDEHKIAFFVNLYNALTQHAVTVLGSPPNSSALRLFYTMMVGYEVGPYRLSLNDIENGVLRMNRAVSVLPKPFGNTDRRRALCVTKLDPRIHFVLNCAANSCPPVLFLTAKNLEDSLSIATKGFLANKSNLKVEGEKVFLSRIFDWYREDFSKDASERGLLEFVVENGDGQQDEVKQVKALLEGRMGEVSVAWTAYDWSLNAV